MATARALQTASVPSAATMTMPWFMWVSAACRVAACSAITARLAESSPACTCNRSCVAVSATFRLASADSDSSKRRNCRTSDHNRIAMQASAIKVQDAADRLIRTQDASTAHWATLTLITSG